MMNVLAGQDRPPLVLQKVLHNLAETLTPTQPKLGPAGREGIRSRSTKGQHLGPKKTFTGLPLSAGNVIRPMQNQTKYKRALHYITALSDALFPVDFESVNSLSKTKADPAVCLHLSEPRSGSTFALIETLKNNTKAPAITNKRLIEPVDECKPSLGRRPWKKADISFCGSILFCPSPFGLANQITATICNTMARGGSARLVQ
ncbi:unnamed protein product [Boreogadus saida]